MVDKYMLDKLAKAINAKAKELANEEKNRAKAAEDELQLNINVVEEMFDGKSLKYLTQAEYDELSENEKNDEGVVYFILDSEDVTVTRLMVNKWDAKAEQADVDNITNMLNGYSLWVGTSSELANIEEKDPKTLYFEIDDGTNDIIEIEVEDDNLILTDDKYQVCFAMMNNVNIVFPIVDTYTEIHLHFDADEDLHLNFPECRCKNMPNIKEGNSYELIAVFNTMHWLIDIVEYKALQ